MAQHNTPAYNAIPACANALLYAQLTEDPGPFLEAVIPWVRIKTSQTFTRRRLRYMRDVLHWTGDREDVEQDFYLYLLERWRQLPPQPKLLAHNLHFHWRAFTTHTLEHHASTHRTLQRAGHARPQWFEPIHHFPTEEE